MAKTTGKFHLGNCNRFTSAFKQPQRGNVLPSGLCYKVGSVLVGHKLDTICVFAVVYGRDVSLKAFALDLVRGVEWEAVLPAGLPTVSHHACGTYHEQREEAYFCDGVDFYLFRADENRVRLVETKGAKPGFRQHHACCTSPSAFFLHGGYGLNDTALHTLSMETMTWSIADIKSQYAPGRRHKFTMSYLDGRIFVMGGYPSWLSSAKLDVFEVKQQRWKSIHSPTEVGSDDKLEFEGETRQGTRSHTAVVTRDRLLILGGHGNAFMHLMVMEVTPAEA